MKVGDLPPEMLCAVFGHLCLADLIRCKLVCKDWNTLISTSIRLTRLVVDRKRDHRIHWYYSHEPVIAAELSEPNLFVAQLNRPILLGLKSLKVHCLIDEFELKDLNLFTNLLRLEINHELASDLSLKLPKLEALFSDVYASGYLFTIVCPNLKTFHMADDDGLISMKIEHPESIVELKINLDEDSNLGQFKNLQRLIITSGHQAFEDFLPKLPRLRLVRFDNELESLLFLWEAEDETVDPTDQLKELLRGLMSAKRRAKRGDLKVYFAGLHLTDATIENIDLNWNSDGAQISNEHYYLKNYEHLQEKIHFVTGVNYTRLMSLVNEVPKDYLDKFCKLHTVTVDGEIKNEDDLLDFLKKLEDLDTLQLHNVSNLSQAFVERLPGFCANLWTFELSDDRGLDLDFGFFGRFKKLRQIILEPELSVRSVKSIINVFKESASCLQDAFNFRCRGVFYRFESQEQHRSYRLYVGSDLMKENCSLDDVISYLEL